MQRQIRAIDLFCSGVPGHGKNSWQLSSDCCQRIDLDGHDGHDGHDDIRMDVRLPKFHLRQTSDVPGEKVPRGEFGEGRLGMLERRIVPFLGLALT